MNELDGKTWLQYSISVWDNIQKTGSENKLDHPAMFPVELVRRLLRIFLSKEQRVVLDPFVGTGSTLLAARELGKLSYGFEISKEYVEKARKRLAEQQNLFKKDLPPAHIIHDDALNLDKYIEQESVDICITSPPYWNILSRKRTADYKEIRDYDQNERNLGNIQEYGKFLKALQRVFRKVHAVLKKNAYCIVVVMDIRKRDRFYPYHMDLTLSLQEIGFYLDDIIIWNRKHEYNNLRPLGYPSVFRVNKVHEFILIFKKRSGK
ncbi:MAG: DNA methyltransferase [Planctomycetota bacterium]|nr:MAG: DNA methyltransferase [Planctomycetota bacterium]